MSVPYLVLQKENKTFTIRRYEAHFANLLSNLVYASLMQRGYTPTLIVKLKSYKHDYLLQQSNPKRKV